MRIEGKKILILGGPGLVGTAVCYELFKRKPKVLQLHGLTKEETEAARDELLREAENTELRISWGDIFGFAEPKSREEAIAANIHSLKDEDLDSFLLYKILTDLKPDIVIDCVNTATAIAYRDIFAAAENLFEKVKDNKAEPDDIYSVLESLYIPRLIRHIQVLYHGMTAAGCAIYIKVGTSGTGGMGLNIPYTHSEERPSRVLLSKSAVAGAQTLLLFLMARTPGAPITKEIKPAAAIAWKKIAYGPIIRKKEPLRLFEAQPIPLGKRFKSYDPTVPAKETGEILKSVYIHTGENGIFSLEEFAMLTTAEQMEFVTPEEIAQYLIFEIEGRNTGHDIINALDNAVLGPSYRAGLMRHWALEMMCELEKRYNTRSVAFEMLGPPRNSKLLFEAHLLREEFGTMKAVMEASATDVTNRLNKLITEKDPSLASEIISIGIPIILDSGEIIRAPKVILPANADEEVTPEKLEAWIHDGWVDLRKKNIEKWQERFRKIQEEIMSIPDNDTSSRFLRNKHFWDEQKGIQPGKIVGWILSVEEKGLRIKH